MQTNTFQLNDIRKVTSVSERETLQRNENNSELSAPMRWVARAVLAIVCFVWYSPSVHAVVKEISKPPALNKIENHYPLGAELQQLRRELRDTERVAAEQLLISSTNGEGDINLQALIQAFDRKKLLKQLAKLKTLSQEQRGVLLSTLEHYKAHGVGQQIIQRQEKALRTFDADMQALFQAASAIDLSDVGTRDELAVQHAQIQQVLSTLNTPLSNMPSRYSTNLDFILPSARNIYTTQAQIDALIGADGGNYQATDSATHSTALISEKVTELGTDPLALYTWVHDTIRWLPSYGVMQGADYTLQAEQGNAFDTASLLIALLREAGHEARYRYGIVTAPIEEVRNWVGDVKNAAAAANLLSQGQIPSIQLGTGGAVEEMRFEHVWVEVKQDNAWYTLDPSYKQYTYTEGMDLQAAVPFDALSLVSQLESSSTSNEAEGWVQGVDANLVETELENYRNELEAYISNNAPQATLGDVLGLQTINASDALSLAAASPSYNVGFSAIVDQLPDVLFHRFHFQLGSATTVDLGASFQWGSELFAINERTTDLVGKDLAISFRPATQADEDAIASFLPDEIVNPEDLPDTLPAGAINMVGELTIDGEVLLSTAPVSLGAALKTRLGFQPPQGTFSFTENDLDAGQYQAIGIDMQGVSPTQLDALQAKLENTEAQLQADNTANLTKHDLVGDILQAGIQGYMAMTYATDRIAAQSAGVAYYRQPSYGTFSTALTVAYSLGGDPAQVTFSGVAMDVDRLNSNVEERANCYEGFVAFNRASGMRSSAYEHEIPEQLFSTETEQAEGVSTAKALALAMAQGQRIYTLTQSNAGELASITIDDGARAEIQSALSAGLEVTVHESPITVNGWEGSGYTVLDAEYGVGIYQISGGVSGGVSDAIKAIQIGAGLMFAALATMANIFGDLAREGFFKAGGRITRVFDLYENLFRAIDAGCDIIDTTAVLMITYLSVILQFAAAILLAGIGALLVPVLIAQLGNFASNRYIEAKC